MYDLKYDPEELNNIATKKSAEVSVAYRNDNCYLDQGKFTYTY